MPCRAGSVRRAVYSAVGFGYRTKSFDNKLTLTKQNGPAHEAPFARRTVLASPHPQRFRSRSLKLTST